MRQENEIRHRVAEALHAFPEASHIGVSVDREIVTLDGSVGSLDVKTAAEEIVSRVEGVSAVVNDLRIDGVSWVHPLVEHILVPVDLSDERAGALRYARLFAEKLGSRLSVLYVDPLNAATGQETAYAERLHRMVELYAEPHLEPYPFDIAVAENGAANAILRQAEATRNDLIVMGTSAREKRGHEPARSVSIAVVRGARCPVLTIDEDDYPPVQRGVGVTAIVCPVNLTAVARQAVLLAANLAGVFHAHLIVVRAVEPEEQTELAYEEHRLHTWLGDLPGTNLRTVRPYREIVVRGRATEAILECVSRFDSDLLVIGAQQKLAGGGGAMTGRTTEELVRLASTPVLAVPHALMVPGASDATAPS
jgi:nucleotide-binding universal stress UspA family protein